MKPLVGIIMGSDSDLPLMQDAAKMLDELNVPYEISIVSCHRTPERMREYALAAAGRGLKVIIACAGGAAHLPGMTASYTTLPVIGVPRQLKGVGGIDSLLSIAQMPPGVPVATVAIDGAKNAGILAAQIVGTSETVVQKAVEAYKAKIASDIQAKAEKLESIGYEDYLKSHE